MGEWQPLVSARYTSARERAIDMQPKTRLRCVVAAAAAAVLGCESPQAKALDQFWGSFTSGQFTDPARWFTGIVPGPGDVAIFRVFGNNPAPYTVTFPGQSILLPPKNYTNTELRVGPNTVDFVPAGGAALSLLACCGLFRRTRRR